MQETCKITETLAYGYSYESTQGELSYEYQHDMVQMIFKNDAKNLNSWGITETLAYGYSYESTQRELSNEYQHDRVQMIFQSLCIVVLWVKVASALEGLCNYMKNLSVKMDGWDNIKQFYPLLLLNSSKMMHIINHCIKISWCFKMKYKKINFNLV